MSAAEQNRFHFLDGLRGIAAFMVVVFHAFIPNIVQALDRFNIPFVSFHLGFFAQSGVNLFFVLSGVVLLRPYLRGQREFKAVEYFQRRIKRIYPPYFFALLFTLFVYWFNSTFPTWYNLKGGLHEQISLGEAVKQAFVFNIDGHYYNLSWWSLQIEMLFYVCVPLIVLAFPKKLITDRRLVILITGTLIVSALLQVTFLKTVPTYYYRNSNSLFRFADYPLCFLLGVLIAAQDFDVKHARSFIALGMVFLAFGWWYEPAGHAAYGLIHAGVIILAFNLRSFQSALSKPFMMWLGERSYSLFLIHYPTFYLLYNLVSRFMPDRNLTYGIVTRVLCFPAALFVSMLLFSFVERRNARGLLTGNMFWPWQTWKLKNEAHAARVKRPIPEMSPDA
jgi:peptidoglycan/LPS O-acetylase OafA/YrhL